MMHKIKYRIAFMVTALLVAIFAINYLSDGPPDKAGMRRAEIWLRDVRDISGRDHRWDFIRWYSYSKVGYAYVVFEGGVESQDALGTFKRAVEASTPPVPLDWNVRVFTNGITTGR